MLARGTNALLAALLGMTFSACTSSAKKPVVVPDSSVRPATTTPASGTRPGVAATGGAGNSATLPQTADATTTTNAATTPVTGTPAASGIVAPATSPVTPAADATPKPPVVGGGAAVGSASGTGSAVVPPSSQTSAQAGNGKTKLNDLSVGLPAGFTLVQQAQADGVTLVGFGKGADFAAVYSKAGSGMTTQSLFVNGSQVTTPEATKKVGNYDWKMIETTKTVERGLPHAGTYYVAGFLMEKGGVTYYGYGKSTSADAARAAAQAVLAVIE